MNMHELTVFGMDPTIIPIIAVGLIALAYVVMMPLCGARLVVRRLIDGGWFAWLIAAALVALGLLAFFTTLRISP